jgi:hypothetical protein
MPKCTPTQHNNKWEKKKEIEREGTLPKSKKKKKKAR